MLHPYWITKPIKTYIVNLWSSPKMFLHFTFGCIKHSSCVPLVTKTDCHLELQRQTTMPQRPAANQHESTKAAPAWHPKLPKHSFEKRWAFEFLFNEGQDFQDERSQGTTRAKKHDTHHRKQIKSMCIKWYYTVKYVKLSYISSFRWSILNHIVLMYVAKQKNMCINNDICNILRYIVYIYIWIYIYIFVWCQINRIFLTNNWSAIPSKCDQNTRLLRWTSRSLPPSLYVLLIKLPVLYPISFP